MFIILRLLFIAGFIYLAYRLLIWLYLSMSSTRACPNCEGKGHWEGVREREECRQCAGSGTIKK